MNVNDFVILPGSKMGMSVKLKAKSVRELQLEKVQLELDNKEMERKLQQLQSNMSREKLERERANGYHWKSGQAGLGLQPQMSQNKENTAKISSGKVKLRVLKEQSPEPAKQLVAQRVASAASTEKPKAKGKPCGQCETKAALLVCLDCGEDYCPSCFARVHQKGALKLHRTTCLQAKVHVPVEKLQAAQQFLKKIYPDESNGKITYEQKKGVSFSEDPSESSSPLPKMPTHDIEEAFTEPTEVSSQCQTGGSLLHGAFNEEESAKFFQEALNQWRSRNSPRKHTEERCCQSEPEITETCEAQTSPPIMKKPVEIQFEEDSLKYMEKLWLKKYKRTPLEMLPDVLGDELKPTKSLINEAPDTTWVGEEEEEDEEIVNAHLAAEEMKKFWADVRKEEPEAVPVNLEPSLKIEILEDTCEEEAEEAADFVIMETGFEEFDDYSGTTSENHKTEPDIFLAQAVDVPTRSPLSSAVDKENDLTFLRNKHEETPRASSPSVQSRRTDVLCDPSSTEEVSSIPYERAATKEEAIVGKKNRSCMSLGQISSSLELAPCESSPLIEFPKDCERALELREASSVTTECSMLLKEVALKEKPICVPYRGLEGFFAMSTSSQEVMADLFSSPRTARQSPSKGISFSGSDQWIKDFSFSECADETVVQDVLNLELAGPSSRLERQSPGARASFSVSHSAKAIPRPFSSNRPFYSPAAQDSSRPSSALQRGPRSSPAAPLSRAASEISEIEDIDVTERNDPFLEDIMDQQALADLESELQTNADLQPKLSGVLSDSPALNRRSKVTSRTCTAFYNNHEIKDYSQSDTIRVYDDYTDDEEDLWQDKQQVMELR
ncbi:zinc finger B-box domain-containing protein 1 [Heteronotia binoei]|uniref:zinc finger B-box domain-containing protein 1 n=1 Tax=Heteronotia binoei TaxID=13085 RepID=UPI0029310DD5|nr:zinc finger B-box domain-containing protein 1 [Heteronotia binoei]